MHPYTPTPKQEATLKKLAEDSGTDEHTILSRMLDYACEEQERKLEALRAELQIGIDQLERGEYTSYDEQTLQNLFDTIDRRGRERLAQQDNGS